MLEFLQSPHAQVVIWVTVLLILSIIGVYLALFFRDRSSERHVSASDLLTGFRDLRDDGDITHGEFDKIRSVLGTKLQDELGSSGAERDG